MDPKIDVSVIQHGGSGNVRIVTETSAQQLPGPNGETQLNVQANEHVVILPAGSPDSAAIDALSKIPDAPAPAPQAADATVNVDPFRVAAASLSDESLTTVANNIASHYQAAGAVVFVVTHLDPDTVDVHCGNTLDSAGLLALGHALLDQLLEAMHKQTAAGGTFTS